MFACKQGRIRKPWEKVKGQCKGEFTIAFTIICEIPVLLCYYSST